MVLVFERLDPSRHDREGFSCGVDALDTYIKARASQDLTRRLAACYVLCEEGSQTIIGYYTLSAFAIEPLELSADLVKRLPRYPFLPAALLGRLAVASKYRGQGMGERLLIDAIERARSADISALALVVDALDGQAAGFHGRYGFMPVSTVPLRLYWILGQVRGRF